MRHSWIPLIASALVGAGALLVASPFGGPFLISWWPALSFALGVALVTLALTELGRACTAWLSRAATLAWIGGGVLAGLGLFATGASFMVRGASLAVNWVAIAGILAAIGGVRVQQRAR